MDFDRSLIKFFRERFRGGVGCVGGGESADDLNQLHHGNGVKKMHANDFVGTLGERGNLGNGNRRGVGAENHFRTANLVELLKDLGFDLKFLADRFNDVVARSQMLAVGGGLDGFEGGFSLLNGNF